MKALVFILVLGNLLFYAFSAGYLGRPNNPDGGRIEQQVAPERMHLVSRGEPPPLTASPAEPAATAVPPVANACLRWTPLSSDEARQLSAKIGEKFASYQLTKRTEASEGSGWWVFIPPQAGKAEADKKATELRLFGVSDYFIISDPGPNRYAISLGVFSSEKGAQERLAELKAKKVRSAELGVRPGKDSWFVVEARGPQSDKATLLKLATKVLPKMSAQDCK